MCVCVRARVHVFEGNVQPPLHMASTRHVVSFGCEIPLRIPFLDSHVGFMCSSSCHFGGDARINSI